MNKYNSKYLIFSDLDSTLLNNDGFFSRETRETVKELYSKGIYLIPLTARSTSDVFRQASRLGIDKLGGIIGANNGSQLFDFKNNTWILNEKISRKVLKEIFNDTFGKFEAKVHYYSDDVTYVYGRGKNSLYWAQMMGSDYVIVDKEEDIVQDINHLTIILKKNTTKKESEEFFIRMTKKYSAMGIDIRRYTDRVYEISPKNISKGHAIKKVMEYLEVNTKITKTFAFGDGENDFTMFDEVNTGIAMENGILELKKAADDITDTNDNNGVAKYIHAHILN